MEPVELVTSKAFSRDELITALLQIGVKCEESPHRIWDYVVRRKVAFNVACVHPYNPFPFVLGLKKISII